MGVAASCCQSSGAEGVEAATREDEAEVTHEDDKEEAKAIAQAKPAKRRAGVAAEGVSMADVKDYVKPVYPKDEATIERITSIIKGNQKMQVLFGHLSPASLGDVVNAFQEVSRPSGQDIIRQGEEGDCLYIIKEGEVDVYIARPGADGKLPKGDRGSKVVSLGPGALFGELALMYSAPRAATICIKSPTCSLWQLDREPFKMLLAKQKEAQYAMYEGWLGEVDILKSLNRYELARLSDLLDEDVYDEGEEIIKQGEPGDKFYLLEEGSCAAYIQGPDGEKVVKEYAKQGDYFGEIALLTNAPRQATVRATGEEGCTVLSLSEEDFTLILGPIKDILNKDIDKYQQYAQFLS